MGQPNVTMHSHMPVPFQAQLHLAHAGLGVTIFGMAYMFVHDGLVHRRFPVGPIAEVPALKRIAVAHKLHHAERYQGVPWGLFLGPQELEAVGAKAELDRLCRDLDLSK